ncbi:inorganic diphosphatase [Mycoplasmopsis gallopavonis]|uniref:Inorganic pyrophosphatase n=1 Tax=Mycoplasmopsis gallopavonis TaxID=76629 RepID=A0A449B0L8_9BACT|nr:inorganic diphosphatase [Mycoplasmopsis gallopavonis]RIV16772.1 inorganic diphosphatase [Mycoplasmopsis gallopavonis]VEU73267.1 inorganic pyrophosphatase [Mycoplasmopsis gallopavonis]
MKNIVKVKIEIQKNSRIKYEYNRKTKEIEVDRILRGDFVYPCNYGFIPNALDWDGDELDVLLYSEETFIPGSVLNARIIGAMKMIDDGETDTKLIAVHEDDYRLSHIQNIKDLPEPFLKTVETFFSTYKNWKRPNITSVNGFENVEWAMKEYEECVELMEKYGSMDKKEFIKKMQEMHPEKYQG